MKIFKSSGWNTRNALIVAALVLVLGCERQNREIAGVKQEPLGSPQYTANTAEATTPEAIHVASVAPTFATGPINGEEIYTKSCGACHQANGQGIPNVFPPLVKSEYVVGDDVERLASIILYGLNGPITVLGVEYNGAMAGLGAQFSNEELAAAATYIRSSWGNSAGAVEADVFEQMREKWGARGAFTIDELGAES